jgi:hypothetical protein
MAKGDKSRDPCCLAHDGCLCSGSPPVEAPAAHAATSGQVMPPSAAISAVTCRQPVRHIFFQPRAFPPTPDRLSGHLPLDLGVSRRPWRPASRRHRPRREQREFPAGLAGFRPCLCPHRTVSLCCRSAMRKLVGASKARCSDKCYLPRRCRGLRRRIPGRLLRTSLNLCRRAWPWPRAATSVESGSRGLHPSSVRIRSHGAVLAQQRGWHY